MVLETERLILRPFQLSDADDVCRICSQKRVTRFLPLPYPYTLQDAKNWIAGQSKDEEHADFAIVLKKNGQLIGSISVSGIKKCQVGEFGYWIDPDFWGNGFATEAARKLIEYAFNSLGYVKLYAKHYAENPASGKVMQKCGMSLVGTLHKHTLKDEIWRDVCLYEILNPSK